MNWSTTLSLSVRASLKYYSSRCDYFCCEILGRDRKLYQQRRALSEFEVC